MSGMQFVMVQYMKIKMGDDSIRFRFSKNELQNLELNHVIQMDVYFSLNQKITFYVTAEKKLEDFFLSCINQVVSLKIPVNIVQEVIKTSSKEGFKTSLNVGENRKMKIQIQCDLKH